VGGDNFCTTIDSLNRRSFDLRYKDIGLSKANATRALQLIEERKPDYLSAKAQAWNHLAYACFLTSHFDSTRMYLDRVRNIETDYPNRPIEEALTYITEARLFLRECRYAEAFTIYDSTITLFRGLRNRLQYNEILPLKRYDHRRYDWARSDYLIGNAVLDYYYRDTQLPVILRLLDEIERNPRLYIDTTQLSILYYTYAGSYETAIADDVANLYLALDNVQKGLELLEDPASRNDYQLANLYQITGYILQNKGTVRWLTGADSVAINRRFDQFRKEVLATKYGWDEASALSPELPLLLLLKADSLFRRYDDPYQNLASDLHLGNAYLLRGDTATARNYYSQGIPNDSIIAARGGSALIWTRRLYNTLLINASEQNTTEQIKQWYSILSRAEAVIDENTKQDYNAQKGRIEAEAFARRSLAFAVFFLVVCAGVTVLLYFLYKRNRQLRFMQNRLIEQKRMEMLTHVVRGISHELSQPLGSITQTLYDTFNDVAALAKGRETLSDQHYNEIVGNIEADLRTVARGKDTISDLVNSFRNTIRENVVDPEAEFNLRDRLEDIVKVVRPGIKSNIELSIDCPPGLVVRTYPLLFGQVITNLISNADQHAFQNSEDPNDRIRIVCRDSAGDLIVKCIDNGIGIPEEELERLCQPFVSKKQTNLGLGLSLVKNIIEQYMKGTLTFSSDKGLTVTLLIPDCVIGK
jgi:signal transduction histidine kinase